MNNLQENLLTISLTLGALSISMLLAYVVLYFFNLKNARADVHDVKKFREEAISAVAAEHNGKELCTLIDEINKVNDRILMPPRKNIYLTYSFFSLFILSVISLFSGVFSNYMSVSFGVAITFTIVICLFLTTLFIFLIALLLLSLEVHYLKVLSRLSEKYHSHGSKRATISCEE